MAEVPGSTCAVYIYREGALSAVGHDLQLLVTDFTLEIGPDLAVVASARTDSLRVAGALRGNRVDESEPGARDRRDIESNAMRDVLEAGRYPVANFRSTHVEAIEAVEASEPSEALSSPAGGRYRVDGRLEIHGVVREVSFTVERQGGRAVAHLPLHQPDFRIKPYRAFLGALRVKPEVMIEVSAPLPPE